MLPGIREFQQHQFKGNYLSVSKAKESFLDRLKREREEAQNPKPVQATNDYEYEEESYKESYVPLPTIDKEVSSDESSEEEEVPQVPVKKIQRKAESNGYATTYDTSMMTKAMIDDMKRQEGVNKLKNKLDDQKRAIKNALLSIDSAPRNNKIVFEPPEPPAEAEYEKETEQPEVKTSKKRKAQLFDEDENEAEMQPESFKVKKQFAGKNGEKLFELQTRFQNDKRFEIDEKFVDADDTFDTRKKYTRDELKERKKLRKEMENWDQNELKEERDNQLSILEGITGESTGYMNNSNYSKPAQKGMLRFDPSKKDHLKYLDLVKGDEVAEEERKDSLNDNQNFEVGEEKFYEVSENLAQSLQKKSDSKPFSIFEMLGVNHEDEPEEEKKPEEAKVLPKLPSFHVNQVRFKYDSSDTDEEAEGVKEARKKKPLQKKAKGGKYSKAGVWRHNFFVADGDERLKGSIKKLNL